MHEVVAYSENELGSAIRPLESKRHSGNVFLHLVYDAPGGERVSSHDGEELA